jgi:hypothetical protein
MSIEEKDVGSEVFWPSVTAVSSMSLYQTWLPTGPGAHRASVAFRLGRSSAGNKLHTLVE